MSATVETLKTVIFVVSIIACVMSMLVLLTYVTFKEMRKKRFMGFIFYISICDFMMGLVTIIGFPESDSVWCTVQGFGSLYFSMGSWFWTTALSYVMYSIVCTGKSTTPDWLLHVVCWGLPALCAGLPLTNIRYADAGNNSNIQWCLLANKSTSPKHASIIWSYFAYFGWLFVTSTCMICWSVSVRLRMRNRTDTLSVIVRNTYNKVSLYPYAMISFWILNYICIEFSTFSSELLSGLSMIFGVSYGTATAIIFFYKSEEAQRRWYDLFVGCVSSCLASFDSKWSMRPSSSVVPIDFEEEGNWNEPFIMSSMFGGSTNVSNTNTSSGSNASNQLGGSNQLSLNSNSNTTTIRTPLHSKQVSNNSSRQGVGGGDQAQYSRNVSQISSQHSVQSNQTGSSIFTLNSQYTTSGSGYSTDGGGYNHNL